MANVSIDKSLITGRFSSGDITDLYLAFKDAFRSYEPHVNLTLPAFRKKFFGHYQTSLQHSRTLTYNNRIAGFALVTEGELNGRRTAWISAAGIRPEYGGRGWMKRLLDSLISDLKTDGFGLCTLEVQTSNEKALHIFSESGFIVNRKISGHTLRKDIRHSGFSVKFDIRDELLFPFGNDSFEGLPLQETPRFIRGERKRLITIIAIKNNQPVASLILNPVSGRIRNIYVLPEFRRQGIGSELLAKTVTYIPRLKIINVDAGKPGLTEFLNFNGFITDLEQYEMLLTIND